MANKNKQSPSKGQEQGQQLHEFTALNLNSLAEKYTKKEHRTENNIWDENHEKIPT